MVSLAVFGCKKEEAAPISPPPGSARPPAGIEAEINILKDILKNDPKNLNALIALGNLSMDGGRFGEAAEAYSKALEIEPGNVDVRVDLGTCLKNTGMPKKAAEEYRKAISINPRHPNARWNLGIVLAYDLGDPQGGADEMEKYLELNPGDQRAGDFRQEIQRLRSLK